MLLTYAVGSFLSLIIYYIAHRPANNVESRKDRRKAENQNGERRVVIALRERDGATKTFVTEREAEGVATAVDNIASDATVYADGAKHWDALHDSFPVVGRINHSEAYSTEKPTPIRPSPTSPAFAAWWTASTITARPATSTSTPQRPLGSKTTAAGRTATPSPVRSLWPWRRLCRGLGRGIGRGVRRSKTQIDVA